MVSDTLEILGSHKEIQSGLGIQFSPVDHICKFIFDLIKRIIHHIISVNDISAQLQITLYKCIHTLCHHTHCVLCHLCNRIRYRTGILCNI